MGIVEIKDKIKSIAKTEEQVIKSETEKKIDDIKKEFQKKKAEMESQFKIDLDKKISSEEKRFDSNLNREIRLKTEALKREILEDVFSEAESRLENISDEDFKKIVEKTLNSLPNKDDMELIVPQGKGDLFKSLIPNSSKIKEDKTLSSGFLLTNKDLSYDFSFKNLLRSKKTNLELEVSKILF